MCIAFDGAYILEAPAADPGITDEPCPNPGITPAGGGGEGGGEGAAQPESLCPTRRQVPDVKVRDAGYVLEVSATLKCVPK
jgi:hypothetical protein